MSKVLVGYAYCHKVQICDANAISSPITYGMPAVTGFTGAFHALSRTLMTSEPFANVSLGGVLLACYDCTPKVYRSSRYRDFTFTQTRNPLKKDGKTAAIVEEGKCNLLMSFLVEVFADDLLSDEKIADLNTYLTTALYQQRIAGGSVMSVANVQFFEFNQIDNVLPLLMPAFVLMDASDDFRQLIDIAKLKNPDSTPLDVLLDVCTLYHIPEYDINGNTHWHTKSIKTGHGWLVPMPMGYQAISEKFDAGQMANVRNPEYPSQYVETIYGLGKWVYPHHLKGRVETAFWRQSYDDGLYLVSQDNQDNQNEDWF